MKKAVMAKKTENGSYNRVKLCFTLFMVFLLLLAVNHIYAADLLAGTTADAIDTAKGSGRNWMYIVDGATSIGAFWATKKPAVFFSVLGIALAITGYIKLAGG